MSASSAATPTDHERALRALRELVADKSTDAADRIRAAELLFEQGSR